MGARELEYLFMQINRTTTRVIHSLLRARRQQNNNYHAQSNKYPCRAQHILLPYSENTTCWRDGGQEGLLRAASVRLASRSNPRKSSPLTSALLRSVRTRFGWSKNSSHGAFSCTLYVVVLVCCLVFCHTLDKRESDPIRNGDKKS